MNRDVDKRAKKTRARSAMRTILSACAVVAFIAVIGAVCILNIPSQDAEAEDRTETSFPGTESTPNEAASSGFSSAASDELDLELGYRHDEVLVSLDGSTSEQEMEDRLSTLDFAVTKDVTSEDIEAGFMTLKIADGSSVEDSMRSLEQAGLDAQPNYVYTVASDDGSSGTDAMDQARQLVSQSAVTVNDALKDRQWGLDAVDAPEAWGIEKCGDRSDKVSVAVIDTGCMINHPDLKDNVLASYNSISKESGDAAVQDTLGHGTHVSGIACATANNSVGVAGVSYNAGLIAIKASDPTTNNFDSASLAAAYSWLLSPSSADSTKTTAEYYNVRVINMSLGGPRSVSSGDRVLTDKIKNAYNGNYTGAAGQDGTHPSILTVVAAGNKMNDSAGNPVNVPYVSFPADYEYCYAVINVQQGSTTDALPKRSTTSNYNMSDQHKINISAPGYNIYSTFIRNNASLGFYKTDSGTSMASPMVAGIAALMFSENPELSAVQAIDIINATATDLDAEGWDRETGYGCINAYHALQIASASLGADEEIEYKNKESWSISYGDGTGWEDYGSPEDWEWSCSDSNVIELTANVDDGTLDVVAIAPGEATVTGVFKNAEGGTGSDITVSKKVTVKKLDVSKADITFDGTFEYTGRPIVPEPIVVMNGTPLVKDSDYTVSYSDNVDPGTATVTIDGIGTCEGEKTATFNIANASVDLALLSIMDDETFTGIAIEPQPMVSLKGFGMLDETTDFTYEYSDNVNAGKGKVRINGCGSFTGTSDWFEFNILPAGLSNAMIEAVPAATYAASPITPTPDVTLNGVALGLGVDFEFSYEDNIDATDAATVIVTGKGNYTGTASSTFSIEPFDMSSATLGGLDASYAYTGHAIEPDMTVEIAPFGTLDGDTDFDASFTDNLDAGTAEVEVNGKGNFTGSVRATFSIEPFDISNATLQEIGEQVWNGGVVEPEPVLTTQGLELVKGRDYTVTYSNNGAAGTATMTIEGINNCSGTITADFEIVFKIVPEMVSAIADQWYTGSAIEPGITVATTGMTLVRDENYSVAFKDNVDAGTASVTITGIHGCAGEVTATFKILPADLSRASIGGIQSYTYDGSAKTPKPPVSLVYYGALEEGVDFKYEYKNNVDAGNAQLRVVGMGNFTGATPFEGHEFAIDRKNLSAASVTLAAAAYTGKALTPDPVVKLDGKTLVKNTDYKVSYYDNVNVGKASAVIEGVGNYRGSASGTFEITNSILSDMISVNHIPTYTGSALTPEVTVHDGNTVLKEGTDYKVDGYANNVNAGTAQVTVSGIGKYSGKATGTFTIRPASISSATIAIPAQKHTGSALTPAPTVKLDGFGTLVEDEDYTVHYRDNVDAGQGTAVITGKGNFTGSKQAGFVIEGSASNGNGGNGSSSAGKSMYRMYNPYSGEHLYTSSASERDDLSNIGWDYEGVGWTAPEKSNTPVYRLYNPNSGDHHYTTSVNERDTLDRIGWNYEGIGWYSDDAKRVPLYRQFNPNVTVGSHNYTTDLNEHKTLVGKGWRDEDIAWYGM